MKPARLTACIRVYLLSALWVTGIFFTLAHASSDGMWRLTINGTSLFFYGTRVLTAGLEQDWRVVIDFQVKGNHFSVGSGKASLVGNPRPFSRPEGMFYCESTSGVYLDRGLHEVNTPHMRYKGFPVSGRITNKRVTLQPDVEYIGNFIAMMYECKTRSSVGDVWLERGRRSAIERAKRQDATRHYENNSYRVNVRELKFVEPRGPLTIPLIDGLSFSQSDQASFTEKTIRLERLAP